jgi:mono/diheme cytochrome c family protein
MAVVAGACAISVAAASAQAPTKTTNDGVYTAAQAERGKKAFAGSCTTCHDTDRFSGATFTDAWAGKPMKEIWDVASGTMPEDNPGSLKQQEYADILAYFLSLNAYPTGDAELAPGAGPMASIKIEKKK